MCSTLLPVVVSQLIFGHLCPHGHKGDGENAAVVYGPRVLCTRRGPSAQQVFDVRLGRLVAERLNIDTTLCGAVAESLNGSLDGTAVLTETMTADHKQSLDSSQPARAERWKAPRRRSRWA